MSELASIMKQVCLRVDQAIVLKCFPGEMKIFLNRSLDILGSVLNSTLHSAASFMSIQLRSFPFFSPPAIGMEFDLDQALFKILL